MRSHLQIMMHDLTPSEKSFEMFIPFFNPFNKYGWLTVAW